MIMYQYTFILSNVLYECKMSIIEDTRNEVYEIALYYLHNF